MEDEPIETSDPDLGTMIGALIVGAARASAMMNVAILTKLFEKGVLDSDDISGGILDRLTRYYNAMPPIELGTPEGYERTIAERMISDIKDQLSAKGGALQTGPAN